MAKKPPRSHQTSYMSWISATLGFLSLSDYDICSWPTRIVRDVDKLLRWEPTSSTTSNGKAATDYCERLNIMITIRTTVYCPSCFVGIVSSIQLWPSIVWVIVGISQFSIAWKYIWNSRLVSPIKGVADRFHQKKVSHSRRWMASDL